MAGQVDEIAAGSEIAAAQEQIQQGDDARATGRSAGVASLFDRAFNWVWRVLRHPAPLLLVALLLLLLLLSARFVPQMPGQISEDPAAAERWINAEAGNWGALAAPIRTLELFTIASSRLLRALLALLILIAAVHLADAIGALRVWRRLSRVVEPASGVVPAPIPIPGVEMGRARFALPVAPAQAKAAVEEWARLRYGANVTALAPAALSENGAENGAENQAGNGQGDEQRLLARRNGASAWLRPLLPAGLLLAALTLWAGVALGWNVRPPTFAPGDTFASDTHNFTLTYARANADSGEDSGEVVASPALQLTLQQGDAAQIIAADGALVAPFGYSVQATQGVPGLYLHTDQPDLLLPGGTQPDMEAGLLFPQAGSEQFVVLPGQGAGLRFVRITDGDEDLYFVEVYGEDGEQPVERLQIEEAMTLSVTGDADTLQIDVVPAPGLNVVVEYRPLTVLFWPALLLALLGMVAWLRPATFAVLQVGRWQQEESVITAQGSSVPEMTGLESVLRQELTS